MVASIRGMHLLICVHSFKFLFVIVNRESTLTKHKQKNMFQILLFGNLSHNVQIYADQNMFVYSRKTGPKTCFMLHVSLV